MGGVSRRQGYRQGRKNHHGGLEGYLYNVKNSIEDEEKGVGGKISAEDKDTVSEAVKEALEWLDDNQEAEKEDYEEKQKEVEKIVNPIMQNVYQGAGGGEGGEGGGAEEEEDEEDEEDEL